MVLESVSRRFHAFIAFYAILYVLKVFFKTLLQSFQAEISVLQRECTKSGRTLFMEYHVLKKIQLGFIDVG
jgi:transketolase N-terminal domain/subunit